MLNIAKTTGIGLVALIVVTGVFWLIGNLIAKKASMGEKINEGMGFVVMAAIILFLAWVFGYLMVNYCPPVKNFVYS